MTTKDKALTLAREGVEIHSPNSPEYIVCAALIEALAQPEQKPGGLAAYVIGCFRAAEVEGLQEALAETTDKRLKDLVERRLMYALYEAQKPQPKEPEQEPVATLHNGGYWIAKPTDAGRAFYSRMRYAGGRVDAYTTPPQRKRLDLASAIEYADARWSGVDVPIEWARHFADAIGAPQRKPLTDEDKQHAFIIWGLMPANKSWDIQDWFYAGIAFAEAAHGIKGGRMIIDAIKSVLKGIDQTEIESPDGWWETSAGAEFGAKKLKHVLGMLEHGRHELQKAGEHPAPCARFCEATAFRIAERGYQRRIDELTAKLAEHKQCTWKQHDDIHMPDTWEADCGTMWTFTEGGPKDNDMKYCPRCSKPVIEAAHGIKGTT